MEDTEQTPKLDKPLKKLRTPKEAKIKPEQKQRGRPPTTKNQTNKKIKPVFNYIKPSFFITFDDN
jgi:hypothetical protein